MALPAYYGFEMIISSEAASGANSFAYTRASRSQEIKDKGTTVASYESRGFSHALLIISFKS